MEADSALECIDVPLLCVRDVPYNNYYRPTNVCIMLISVVRTVH